MILTYSNTQLPVQNPGNSDNMASRNKSKRKDQLKQSRAWPEGPDDSPH